MKFKWTDFTANIYNLAVHFKHRFHFPAHRQLVGDDTRTVLCQSAVDYRPKCVDVSKQRMIYLYWIFFESGHFESEHCESKIEFLSDSIFFSKIRIFYKVFPSFPLFSDIRNSSEWSLILFTLVDGHFWQIVFTEPIHVLIPYHIWQYTKPRGVVSRPW